MHITKTQSYHRKGVHNWFPQAEQPAVNTQDKTCLCNTAVWPPPEDFRPDRNQINKNKKHI